MESLTCWVWVHQYEEMFVCYKQNKCKKFIFPLITSHNHMPANHPITLHLSSDETYMTNSVQTGLIRYVSVKLHQGVYDINIYIFFKEMWRPSFFFKVLPSSMEPESFTAMQTPEISPRFCLCFICHKEKPAYNLKCVFGADTLCSSSVDSSVHHLMNKQCF